MPRTATILRYIRRLLGGNGFLIGVPQRLVAFSATRLLLDDKLQSARRLEINDESLTHSGTTDGDIPSGVYQQRDLCADPAVSKVAHSP